MKERLHYMDMAKGVGILCVIVGHLGSQKISNVIYSFHMPLFFLISGYFICKESKPINVIKKRIKQLLPAYLLTTLCIIVLVCICNIIDILTGGNIKDLTYDVGRWIYAAIWGAGSPHKSPIHIPSIGAIWFLLATIISNYLVQIAIKKRFSTIIIIGFVLTGSVLSYYIWLPFSVQPAMCASLFVFAGYIFKELSFFDKTNDIKTQLTMIAFLMWIELIYINLNSNSHFDIAFSYYPNRAMDFIGGCCGALCVISFQQIIWDKISNKRLLLPLEWIGKHSLIILCIHEVEGNIIHWSEIICLNNSTLDLLIILILRIILCVFATYVIVSLRQLYHYHFIEHT